ncbi:MAG: ribosome-associated translation inhibitor RaiA [Dermatophilaceae bacterium]
MDIVVTGRHLQISDRFREHLDDRLSKVAQVAPHVERVEVVATHDGGARNSARVEFTCRDREAVVRAEANNDDKYTAVDIALEKLIERLRRAKDRRRTAIRGRSEGVTMPPPAAAPAARAVPVTEDAPEEAPAPTGPFGAVGDSPIEVRQKVHPSEPMSLGEAVKRMELVGHDFYLFNDAETGKASVVYRRRGWSYGVIHLEPVGADG